MVAVFVDVVVVFINDGDDVAAATRFEISVIIVVVITDGIRNNIDISGKILWMIDRARERQAEKKPSTAPELVVAENR